MNMISSNSIVDYEEKYINPYSKVIDNEPTPLLDILLFWDVWTLM